MYYTPSVIISLLYDSVNVSLILAFIDLQVEKVLSNTVDHANFFVENCPNISFWWIISIPCDRGALCQNYDKMPFKFCYIFTS